MPTAEFHMGTTTKMHKKSINSPDETRTFDKGKVHLTKIGDTTISRMYLEPGWSWENV